MSAYDKFMTPNFKSAKHGSVTDNIQGAIPSTVVDDKPLLHATAQKQDPLSLSAIGVGLLSLVTMLGVHLRRRMQPATVVASSSGLALDMPMNTASAVGDNVMEMQSEDSHKMSSSRVGWGQLSAQNTRPSTLCYAESEDATEAEAVTESQAAPTQPQAAATLTLETQPPFVQEDLKSLAKSLNPIVGYWDPLRIGGDNKFGEGFTIWEYNQERTIAWFRQAEIKHGRVAMAAFVGYWVQASGYHWPFKMTLLGGDWPTGTPPEQWDALPAASKWQIILFVGVLELYDEATPPHYTNGRKPGEFPSFKGTYAMEAGLAPFDLYDPFGLSKNISPEKKAMRLRTEINNGRLAMLAVFAFLSESKAPGAVPLLTGKIPAYSGDYMIPFEGNFDLFG